MNLEVIGGDSAVRQLRLKALLPEGKLVFGSKSLDLGGIPVGVPQTSVVILKNIGLHDAMFQVGALFVASYTCRDGLDCALHFQTSSPLLQYRQTSQVHCILALKMQFGPALRPNIQTQQITSSAQT